MLLAYMRCESILLSNLILSKRLIRPKGYPLSDSKFQANFLNLLNSVYKELDKIIC